MAIPTYKASKTRSSRPGWSVTFNHPNRRNANGKLGLKVRRGLGTRDDSEADRLVEQLDLLLSDQSWWSADRRSVAEHRFNKAVVSAFYDGIEVGKIDSRSLRENIIPLPLRDDGYARVMLVGTTGAGKTTLLRQLIGSDPKRDRFPSTSTAKTTTAEIEIITAGGPFEAVITFMSEHEVRCAVDECLEEACKNVIQGSDDAGIASALLEHREQRFRLSYPLGAWLQELPDQEMDSQDDMNFDFGDDEDEPDTLAGDETVNNSEISDNNRRLEEYIDRIKEVATEVRQDMKDEHGDYGDKDTPSQRREWMEYFVEALSENRGFADISLDIMDVINTRFALIKVGEFERIPTGWPTLWHYKEEDRDIFLKQVRWFSSNHVKQFGRLLTPLVDGIRVRGRFRPSTPELQGEDRKLVLLDGEGLGHSAKEATSISTKVTEKFSETDMILLVDNAQSPMQAAPLELLRSVGISGHAHKLAVAFTHFDQVRGYNLRSFAQKRDHVKASIGNAIASMSESLGPSITESLEVRLKHNDFYLGALDSPAERIPNGVIVQMRDMLDRIQNLAEPSAPVDLAPIYNIARLELGLRDAADGFKRPWWGRLGLGYHEGVKKEYWSRVKALCRRIVGHGYYCEYDDLRPIADLVSQLQASISLWLENPNGWTRMPINEDEMKTVIDEIRQSVYSKIHELSKRRLVTSHTSNWRTAYEVSGRGSSYERAKTMGIIYEAAAPSVSSAMDAQGQEFLNEIVRIVRESIEDVEGSVVEA